MSTNDFPTSTAVTSSSTNELDPPICHCTPLAPLSPGFTRSLSPVAPGCSSSVTVRNLAHSSRLQPPSQLRATPPSPQPHRPDAPTGLCVGSVCVMTRLQVQSPRSLGLALAALSYCVLRLSIRLLLAKLNNSCNSLQCTLGHTHSPQRCSLSYHRVTSQPQSARCMSHWVMNV